MNPTSTVTKEQQLQYDEEIQSILQGTHQGFKNAVQILELEYDECVQRANLYRDYQLDCARHLFELEKHMSLQEYQQDFQGLQEEMLDKLEDKKQRIKEEFEDFEIEPLEGLETRLNNTRNSKARSQRAEERKEKRSKKGNGASLVFVLKDSDIYEDVSVMRRVCKLYPGSPSVSTTKGWQKEILIVELKNKLIFM